MKKRISILLVVLCTCIANALAQNPQWIIYTTQNSQLPSNVTGSIVIDTNNIKWIGTSNGIVRINGNLWTIFDSTNSPIDNEASPWALDNQNRIWIGTLGKGIAVYDNGEWTTYNTTNSGLPNNYIRNISVDPLTNIKWIATQTVVTRFDGYNWTSYDTTNSQIPSNNIFRIKAKGDTVWIGTFFKGLARYCNNIWTIYNIQNSNIPGNIISDIDIDNRSNKWIATYLGNGLGKFNDNLNIWTVYNTTNSGLPMNNLHSVKYIEGKVWIGTFGQGLAVYNDTNWIVFNTENSPIPGGDVHAVEIDKYKNIWITCGGGLAVYNETGILGIKKDIQNVPKNFELLSPYPNPFNPQINISFIVSKMILLQVSIYDVNGKFITNVANDYFNLGIHTLKWNAESLSSGIYFIKFQNENYSISQKIVLYK